MKIEEPSPNKESAALFPSHPVQLSPRHWMLSRLHYFLQKRLSTTTMSFTQGQPTLPTTLHLVKKGCFVFDERDMSVF